MASEATKTAVGGNMHMDIRVIQRLFISNLRFNLTPEAIWRLSWPQKPFGGRHGHRGYQKKSVESVFDKYRMKNKDIKKKKEATKIAVRSNMHIDTRVMKVAGFKSDIQLDI